MTACDWPLCCKDPQRPTHWRRRQRLWTQESLACPDLAVQSMGPRVAPTATLLDDLGAGGQPPPRAAAPPKRVWDAGQ